MPWRSVFRLGMMSGFSGLEGKRRGPLGNSSGDMRTRAAVGWFSADSAISWASGRLCSFSSETNQPTPWRDSIRSISSSDLSASRKVERLTPKSLIRSRSAGSWKPDWYVPSSTCAANLPATISDKDLRGISSTSASLLVYWSDHYTKV